MLRSPWPAVTVCNAKMNINQLVNHGTHCHWKKKQQQHRGHNSSQIAQLVRAWRWASTAGKVKDGDRAKRKGKLVPGYMFRTTAQLAPRRSSPQTAGRWGGNRRARGRDREGCPAPTWPPRGRRRASVPATSPHRRATRAQSAGLSWRWEANVRGPGRG
jgi:hypothetical protein